jgi:hypothetical protein
MYSPQQFSQKTGLSYGQILIMCKKKEIESVVTDGGHFKIPEKEVAKFQQPDDYISKTEYEKVVRENEKLKTIIIQFKSMVAGL